MIRRFLSLFLLGAIGTLLIACGGSPDPTAVPEQVTAPTSPPEAAVAAPAADATLLVAHNIKNPESEMVAAPEKYSESPFSAKLVADGNLPPVEERLPSEPMVLQVATVGKYGGEIRRNHLGPQDANCNVGRFNGRGLIRWAGDGSGWVPQAIRSWESNADGTVWTINMIPGT